MLPIAMPAIVPPPRPRETEGEGVAVVELVLEAAGDELVPVIVPRAVVTGLRRTVDVYPEYAAQPYPTEP
jgi:hypothetical protein